MSFITDKIKNRFGSAVLETHDYRGDETVVVKKENVFEVAKFLKEDAELDFNVLMDQTAVDNLNLDKPVRFEIVYHFYSYPKNHRLRLKTPVEEDDPVVDSVVGLWPVANWFEREIWDMFGIKFQNHPDLRRILMYEEFQGHPLRKDYPINKRQPLIGPKN